MRGAPRRAPPRSRFTTQRRPGRNGRRRARPHTPPHTRPHARPHTKLASASFRALLRLGVRGHHHQRLGEHPRATLSDEKDAPRHVAGDDDSVAGLRDDEVQSRRQLAKIRVRHFRHREQFGRAQKRRRSRRLRLLDDVHHRVVLPLSKREERDVGERRRRRRARLPPGTKHGARAERLARLDATRERPGAARRAQRARLRLRPGEVGRALEGRVPHRPARRRRDDGPRGFFPRAPGNCAAVAPRPNVPQRIVRHEPSVAMWAVATTKQREFAAHHHVRAIPAFALAAHHRSRGVALQRRRLEDAREVAGVESPKRGHAVRRGHELALERLIHQRRPAFSRVVVPMKRGGHRATVRVARVQRGVAFDGVGARRAGERLRLRLPRRARRRIRANASHLRGQTSLLRRRASFPFSVFHLANALGVRLPARRRAGSRAGDDAGGDARRRTTRLLFRVGVDRLLHRLLLILLHARR